MVYGPFTKIPCDTRLVSLHKIVKTLHFFYQRDHIDGLKYLSIQCPLNGGN